MTMIRARMGITLIESLVVIAIMVCLLALILPAVQYARALYEGMQCKSNLRQITLALHHFHSDYNRVPPLPGNAVNSRIHTRAFWRVQILPYIENENEWKIASIAYGSTVQESDNPPHTGFSRVIKLFTCPTDSRLRVPQLDSAERLAGFSSYLGVSGAHEKRGMFGNLPGISFSAVADGLSNTLFIGERPPPANFMAGHWYANPDYSFLSISQKARMWPNDYLRVAGHLIPYETECVQDFSFKRGSLENPCDRGHNWSLHHGGAHFSSVDGSVRFYRYEAADLVAKMASHSGGEAISSEE